MFILNIVCSWFFYMLSVTLCRWHETIPASCIYFLFHRVFCGACRRLHGPISCVFSFCHPRRNPDLDCLYHLLLQLGDDGHWWLVVGRLSTCVCLVLWAFMDECASELVTQNSERQWYWWTLKLSLMELASRGGGSDIKMKSRVEKWLSFFSFLYVGSLQIQYSLGGTKEPYNIDVDHRSMANGQPHSVNVTRHERTITLKVHMCYSSVGCDAGLQSLSSVMLGCWFWLVLFWAVRAGGRDASDTFSYKLLTCEVERYPVPIGRTVTELMEKRFLGRR